MNITQIEAEYDEKFSLKWGKSIEVGESVEIPLELVEYATAQESIKQFYRSKISELLEEIKLQPKMPAMIGELGQSLKPDERDLAFNDAVSVQEQLIRNALQ